MQTFATKSRAGAALKAEPDLPPQDEFADDEPKYLRRQKPVEIRRRKFGRQQRATWLRWMKGGVIVLAAGLAAYAVADFVRFSPVFRLDVQAIETTGMKHVTREALLARFGADDGRSVLLVPLAARRAALEQIPWVEHARVERILPDRLRVEIVERTPVAFLRAESDLLLVDAEGVILERPELGEFRFPVVTGVSEAMSPGDRAARMKMFVELLQDAERARPGASLHVSEVDLSDPADLCATLAGLDVVGDPAAAGSQETVLVHFGDRDFEARFRVLAENFGQWKSSAGRVESIDLRFERQVVVNPETASAAPAKKRSD